MRTTWSDGGSSAVNVGHPIHGAAADFIWLDYEDGAHDADIGWSHEHHASRSRGSARHFP